MTDVLNDELGKYKALKLIDATDHESGLSYDWLEVRDVLMLR